LGTHYSINENILKLRWGPFFWNINILEIVFIRLNQKTIGGFWKPTLSWNSIEIRYKRSKSVFISPNPEEEFISDLRSTNQNIEIKPK
jgi:hypothetical protein